MCGKAQKAAFAAVGVINVQKASGKARIHKSLQTFRYVAQLAGRIGADGILRRHGQVHLRATGRIDGKHRLGILRALHTHDAAGFQVSIQVFGKRPVFIACSELHIPGQPLHI